MVEPTVALGRRVGPFEGRLDADLLRRYAAVTNDPSALSRSGLAVPPVAIVTQIWDAQSEGRRDLVSDDFQRSAIGGVHGEHDIVLHRPIEPGEPLRIWVEAHGTRQAGRNALVTLRYSALDHHDSVVAEQWWITGETMVVDGGEMTRGYPRLLHCRAAHCRAPGAAKRPRMTDERCRGFHIHWF